MNYQLDKSFWKFNQNFWLDWSSCVLFCAMTALAISVVILHRRYKMLINAVLGMATIPMTKAASLTSTFLCSRRTKRDSFYRTHTGDSEQIDHYIAIPAPTIELTHDEIKTMFRVSRLFCLLFMHRLSHYCLH